MDKLEYTYTGPVYIRPIGRGTVIDPDGEGTHLADILFFAFGSGDYNMEITIKVLPTEAAK